MAQIAPRSSCKSATQARNVDGAHHLVVVAKTLELSRPFFADVTTRSAATKQRVGVGVVAQLVIQTLRTSARWRLCLCARNQAEQRKQKDGWDVSGHACRARRIRFRLFGVFRGKFLLFAALFLFALATSTLVIVAPVVVIVVALRLLLFALLWRRRTQWNMRIWLVCVRIVKIIVARVGVADANAKAAHEQSAT